MAIWQVPYKLVGLFDSRLNYLVLTDNIGGFGCPPNDIPMPTVSEEFGDVFVVMNVTIHGSEGI